MSQVSALPGPEHAANAPSCLAFEAASQGRLSRAEGYVT